VVRRFGVYRVDLNPVRDAGMRKSRPCVVVSPNEMHSLRTVIIAPMTTKGRPYPNRTAVRFARKKGWIALDQIRTVDRSGLRARLGRSSPQAGRRTLSLLQEMFAE